MSPSRYSLAIALAFGLLLPSIACAEKEQEKAPVASFSSASDTCELLTKGAGIAMQDTDAKINEKLNSLVHDLNENNFEHIATYFHPKAKVKDDFGDTLKGLMAQRYDPKVTYSIFRVWRLGSKQAGKPVLDDCAESDGARVIGSHGYEKQYAIWIQIMGQNELGRLLLSAIPDGGELKLVGLGIQQWTQSGGDWQVWTQRAEAAEAKANRKEAYLAYDIAQKLLKSGDFVVYPLQAKLQQKRDEMFTQPKLVEAVNSDLGIQSMAYVGTLLGKEGSGLFIREFLKSELSAHDIDNLCHTRGRGLQKMGWLDATQGVRCNYIFKGMNPNQDSGLGGLYLTAEDLKSTKK